MKTRRTGSIVLVISTLVALLATSVAVGQPDRLTRRGRGGSAEKVTTKGFGVGPKMTAAEEAFAIKVKPVPSEVVQGLVPQSVAGMKRVSLDGSARYFGPAGTSKVQATFLGDGGEELRMEIVDPCGIPTKGVPYYLEMLQEGQRQEDEKAILEGHAVAGHPAVLKTDKTGRAGQQLQLFLYPRMRVTITGEQIDVGAMLKAAAALELDALASLAPEVPPGVEPFRMK